MHDLPDEAFLAALAQTVQEALLRGETVELPELGTFRIVHRQSEIAEDADGAIVMKPPRDVIAFSPL